MVSKFPDVKSRLAHVMAECRYTKDAQFARAVGVTPQNVGNWRKRNTWGDSAPKIKAVTGASLDWLDSGAGVAFPSGPIVFTGAPVVSAPDARIDEIEESLDYLGGVLQSVIRSLGRLAPAEAAAVAREVRENLTTPGRVPEVLVELLKAADAAVPVAVPAERARPARKQR